MRSIASRIPLVAAGLHLLLFAATVAYVYTSSAGQVALVWALWVVPDFPVSLLHYVGPAYSRWIHEIVPRDSALDYVVYTPHVIHGFFGTLWWYLMTRCLVALYQGHKAKNVT